MKRILRDKRYTKHFNQDCFEVIDTAEKAYVLGLLFADANIDFKSNRISLDLHEKDVELLDYVAEVLEYKDVYNKHQQQLLDGSLSTYLKLSFSSSEVKNDLIRLGCTPRKSRTLKFPTEEQVPHKFINSFILGYFDGDGHVSNTNGGGQIMIAGTEDMCKGILRATHFLNLENPYYKLHNNASIFVFHLSRQKDTVKFLDWCYTDAKYFLHRKYDRYLKIKMRISVSDINNELRKQVHVDMQERLDAGQSITSLASNFNMSYSGIYKAIKCGHLKHPTLPKKQILQS